MGDPIITTNRQNNNNNNMIRDRTNKQ